MNKKQIDLLNDLIQVIFDEIMFSKTPSVFCLETLGKLTMVFSKFLTEENKGCIKTALDYDKWLNVD